MMTNQQVFQGFSQYLDAMHLLKKDTSNKNECLNDYLQSAGLSSLILLSKETQWHVDTAYEKHIERVNSAKPTMGVKQFFALKPENADNKETLFETFALPRELAVAAYRENKNRTNPVVVLRDVAEGTAVVKIADIEPIEHDSLEKDDQAKVTLKLFSGNTYSETLAIKNSVSMVMDELLRNTKGISNPKLVNRLDEWGNRQPVLEFVADSIALPIGTTITFDPSLPEYNVYMDVDETYASLGPEMLDDEHAFIDSRFDNPFAPEPSLREASTNDDEQSADEQSADEQIDELFSNMEVADAEVDSSNSIDDIEEITEVTSIDESDNNDESALPSKDEESTAHAEEAVKEGTENTNSEPLPPSPQSEQTIMPASIFLIDDLNEDTPLQENKFFNALKQNLEDDTFKGERTHDILTFLKDEGFVVGQHKLDNDQKKIVYNTYAQFKAQLNELKSEMGPAVEAQHSEVNERIADAEPSEVNPTPTEDTSTEQEMETSAESSDVQSPTADTPPTEEVKEEPVEEKNAESAQAETETTQEVPAEKTVFNVDKLDGLPKYEMTGFYHWLADKNESNELKDNDIQNIGHYLLDMGFNKHIHKTNVDQVKVMKSVMLAFKIDRENDAIKTSDIEASDLPAGEYTVPAQKTPKPTSFDSLFEETKSNTEQIQDTTPESVQEVAPEPEVAPEQEAKVIPDPKPEVVSDPELMMDEQSTSTITPEFYEELHHLVSNSLFAARALNKLTGDFSKDIQYCINYLDAIDDVDDDMLNVMDKIYDDAIAKIKERENYHTAHGDYFQLISFKGDMEQMEVVHHCHKDAVSDIIQNKERNGFNTDVVPIKPEQITARVEDAHQFSNGKIQVRVALHAPSQANNIDTLLATNPGLSAEISENFHNISAVAVEDRLDENCYPVTQMFIICDSTDYMPGTLMFPKREQFKGVIPELNSASQTAKGNKAASNDRSMKAANNSMPVDNKNKHFIEPVENKNTRENTDDLKMAHDNEMPMVEPISEVATVQEVPNTEEDKSEDEVSEDELDADLDEFEAHLDQMGF